MSYDADDAEADAESAGPTMIMGTALSHPDLRAELGIADAEAAIQGIVLVVEADPSHPAATVLEHAGYQVHCTEDGVLGTQWLATMTFDVVVTDVTLRGMGGIELLRYAHEHDRDLPVLLMTGAPDVESASQAIEHGAFQYLLKPLAGERLVSAVDKAVGMRRMARMKSEALQFMEDFDTVVSEPGDERSRWDNAMKTLWMAYQPIILPDGKLFAYEALVRSDEPTMRGAGEILDAAERQQTLLELGRTVRGNAGHFVSQLRPEWSLFVNLHAEDLLDDLLTSPDAALSKIAPGVVLEITEREAVHDVGEARAKMAELRAMGFRIALDDLGAGYAGLTSFAMLQPDIVKLDMGLVRDVDRDPVKRKIVGSLTNVSRDLGILVVGEGVETPGERDTLIELGCHLLQGYLFGKPQRL